MAKLLMITGLGSARDLASGKRGAFYNTLEEFSKHWERIDIISPKILLDSEETEVKPLFPLFGNVYIHVSPWPLVLHPVFFIIKALETYKEQKFDLMTVHEFPPFYNGIAARILWQFLRVPYILEIFHIPGYPRAISIKEKIYKNLLKLFVKYDVSRARAVRVMNQTQVPDFLIRSGVSKEKIVYIPAVYIDTDIFKPTGAQKEYDLIFIGRLEKNKGLDLFIETVKKTNSKAIVVGDGSLFKGTQLEIRNSRLEIIMHGWAKDSKEIAELLNRSKLLVMPSYNEGGPRVVVEALACGVPVLATSVGIVPDLLKNGLGGEIIDWEAEDIATKVDALLSDSGRYQKYSQSGPGIASQFEKRAAIKNYADKLKQLISNKLISW